MPTPQEQRLSALRGGAPELSRNVRNLARFASNHACPTANLSFAARVDLDALLKGTEHAAPFGQSPFAFERGNKFEAGLRHNNHEPLRALLQDTLGYVAQTARVKDLRTGAPPNQHRALATETALTRILNADPKAANLLDGAVFVKEIGGKEAYFEADAVAAELEGALYAGEVKSFPLVDGQADPEKVSAALSQASIYILLLQELIERLGGDPERVSEEALLILPKNVGLQPTMTKKSVSREVARAQRIFKALPRVKDIADGVSSTLPSFGVVGDAQRSTEERLEAAHQIVEEVGVRFRPSCLSSCGFSKLCRSRAQERGELARVGGQLERILPSVTSFERITELSCGAPATAEEAPATERLLEAARLLNDFARQA